MVRGRSGFWQGGVPLVVAAIALYEWVDSAHLSAGAGLFPRLVSSCTGVGALAIWAAGLRRRDPGARPQTGVSARFFWVALMGVAFYASCFLVGFYPSAFLMGFAAPFYLKRGGWLANAAGGAALAAGCWLLFGVALHLLLPTGIVFSGT